MDVLEGSTTRIEIKVVGADNKAVKDGTVCVINLVPVGPKGAKATQEAASAGGVAPITYVAALLDPDEMSRTYIGICSIKGEPKVPPQQFQIKVWAGTIQVEIKDAATRPLEGVQIKVTGGGRSYNNFTARDGKPQVVGDGGRLVSGASVYGPGGVTVEILAPYMQVGAWTNPNPRTFQGVARREYKTKFRWPTGAHKQYVNLAYEAGHYEYGNVMEVWVETDDKGQSGDSIFVSAEFDSANSKRNDPKPAVFDLVKNTEAEANGGPGKYKLELKRTDGNLTPNFRVQLGKAGLDKLTLRVGATKGAWDHSKVDETVVITTWRKIYYQITTANFGPTDLTPEVKAMISAALGKAGIEIEKFATVTLTPEELRAIHRGIVVTEDRARKGGDARKAALVINMFDEPTHRGFGAKAKSDKGPLGAQVILADGFFRAVAPVTKEVTLEAATLESFILATGKTRFFKTSLETGAGFVTAEWRPDDGIPADHAFLKAHPEKAKFLRGEYIALNPDSIKLIAEKVAAVKITLPSDGDHDPGKLAGPKATVGKWPVKVKITAVGAESIPALGGNFGVNKFMTGHVTDENKKSVAQTFLHEMGHAMKQAVAPASVAAGSFKFMKDAGQINSIQQTGREATTATAHCSDTPPGMTDHQSAYIGRGHTGPHCYNGIGKKDEYTTEAGKCIMFGSGNTKDDDKTPSDYCAECLRLLKGTDIDSIRKIWVTP